MRIVVDIDTTGIENDDEILALCLVDADTLEVLFNERFRPERHKVWPDAEEVNGISPEDVKGMPLLKERLEDIDKFLMCADAIIGYNVLFELTHLASSKAHINMNAEIIDVMKSVAPVLGDIVQLTGESKYQKLRTVADFFKIPMEEGHSSANDCLTTARVYQNIEILFPDSVIKEM